MKRALVAAAGFGVAIVATAAFAAQARVDFSGTWVFDAARSDVRAGASDTKASGPAESAPPGRVAGGADLTITQTAQELRIQRQGRGGTFTTAYALDGSESTNRSPRGGETVTVSHWQDDTLVTEGRQKRAGDDDVAAEFKETRRLDEGGRTMIVETTRVSPRGGHVRKLVYTRKPGV